MNVNKNLLHDIVDTLPEHGQDQVIAVDLHLLHQVAAVTPVRPLSLAASRHVCCHQHHAHWRQNADNLWKPEPRQDCGRCIKEIF